MRNVFYCEHCLNSTFTVVDLWPLRWGTPFLLQLGLSEQAASLVWLAGPISGLIAQPLIGSAVPSYTSSVSTLLTCCVNPGAISDASTSKYRRRVWIVSATAVIGLGMLLVKFRPLIECRFLIRLFTSVSLALAYAVEIATFIVDTLGGGQGDWDPVRNGQVSSSLDSQIYSRSSFSCARTGQQRRSGALDHVFLYS